MTKFNKGDKVRFIGKKRDFNEDVTRGKVYEIHAMNAQGDASFYDDAESENEWSYISTETEHLFELVPEESPLTETDIIANLALRVSELERAEIRSMHEAEASAYAKYGNPYEEQTEGKVDNAATTQAERIEAVCNEVRGLLIRKNHDYGDSFSKQYAKYGILSGLMRMDDKMARLDTLINGADAQVDESIDDSIADLAGYALLTLVERRKDGK